MPRYYFDVKNGHRLVDPAGIDCESDAEATKQARVIAATIAEEDRRLLEMRAADKSTVLMAVALKRTLGAIRGRLAILRARSGHHGMTTQ